MCSWLAQGRGVGREGLGEVGTEWCEGWLLRCELAPLPAGDTEHVELAQLSSAAPFLILRSTIPRPPQPHHRGGTRACAISAGQRPKVRTLPSSSSPRQLTLLHERLQPPCQHPSHTTGGAQAAPQPLPPQAGTARLGAASSGPQHCPASQALWGQGRGQGQEQRCSQGTAQSPWTETRQ